MIYVILITRHNLIILIKPIFLFQIRSYMPGLFQSILILFKQIRENTIILSKSFFSQNYSCLDQKSNYEHNRIMELNSPCND